MDTRRQWMTSVAASSLVVACGCTREREPAAASQAAAPAGTGPEPWEPIDAAFDGCAGG